MPYPKRMMDSFRSQYGSKEGTRRFFAFKNANPGKYGKALRTAQREGPSHVAGHSSVVSKMLKKKRGK